MPIYLRLDQHQVNEQHYEVMLDVFVGEALAAWALSQADALSKRTVIGFAVGRVELMNGEAAFYANRHSRSWSVRVGVENTRSYYSHRYKPQRGSIETSGI